MTTVEGFEQWEVGRPHAREDEGMTNAGEGLLHLLKAEPTLLDPAPADASAGDIDRRRLDEVHACLRCGEQAHVALVAELESGRRWLDLCHPCHAWLRAELDQAGRLNDDRQPPA